MDKKFLPVASPVLDGNEAIYLQECIEKNWITQGDFVARFEKAFAEFCKVKHAIAIVNGTAALHVALLAHGIGPGDEVIVPSLTYIATANSVSYCGATVVFADVNPETWNLDPVSVERMITPRTKALIPVHLYGQPAPMNELNTLAEKHGLAVIEDAAEAHGARYQDRLAGGLSHSAAFSFYGNKIIATGEGGMITTDDEVFSARCRLIRGQGMDPERRYIFPIIGYNYRMTNLCGAIGVAQMERIEALIEKKRWIDATYRKMLAGTRGITLQGQEKSVQSSCWIFTLLFEKDFGRSRDDMMDALLKEGIETRPVFYPIHTMPPYLEHPRDDLSISDAIARKGVNLPSGCDLTEDDIARVCETILKLGRNSSS